MIFVNLLKCTVYQFLADTPGFQTAFVFVCSVFSIQRWVLLGSLCRSPPCFPLSHFLVLKSDWLVQLFSEENHMSSFF